MSPFVLSDADHAATTRLGGLRRARTTVGDASDAYAAHLIADYLKARTAGDREQMLLIRDNAAAVDPQLVDELNGFDYPAAA
ncbi:hypothetical protein [Streptomyces sp. H27-D2]|uniref:hypothetical protein n=1 Tax=Streptomyces sp. H27-D2 TaxID=3046304 RepID=UPI002DB595AB|nr:hypothetical protein [Streptomyces sp. H27-D2]MEC4016071.1 hypothetical protein [Streptomyces sp. H27-D2]